MECLSMLKSSKIPKHSVLEEILGDPCVYPKHPQGGPPGSFRIFLRMQQDISKDLARIPMNAIKMTGYLDPSESPRTSYPPGIPQGYPSGHPPSKEALEYILQDPRRDPEGYHRMPAVDNKHLLIC